LLDWVDWVGLDLENWTYVQLGLSKQQPGFFVDKCSPYQVKGGRRWSEVDGDEESREAEGLTDVEVDGMIGIGMESAPLERRLTSQLNQLHVDV